VAITYHWIDQHMEPMSAVFDVVQLTQRHTAPELAIAIARRIDMRTVEEQCLFGVVTDNARNVRKAAIALVESYSVVCDAAAGDTDARWRVFGSEDAMDDSGDDEEVGDEADGADEFDAMDRQRAWSCVAHTLNLCLKDAERAVTNGLGRVIDRCHRI